MTNMDEANEQLLQWMNLFVLALTTTTKVDKAQVALNLFSLHERNRSGLLTASTVFECLGVVKGDDLSQLTLTDRIGLLGSVIASFLPWVFEDHMHSRLQSTFKLPEYRANRDRGLVLTNQKQ